MVPTRRGYRMNAEVITAKTEALGWKAKKIKNYINECRKNKWR